LSRLGHHAHRFVENPLGIRDRMHSMGQWWLALGHNSQVQHVYHIAISAEMAILAPKTMQHLLAAATITLSERIKHNVKESVSG